MTALMYKTISVNFLELFNSRVIKKRRATLVSPLEIFIQDGSHAHSWVSFPFAIRHTNHVHCSKGISGSSLPYSRRAPSWLKTSTEEVAELIVKFAKKGLSPSQIGIQLRDSNGIGQVKNLTGTKIIRILRANGTQVVLDGWSANDRFCRLGPQHARGLVLPDQEGCLCP